MSYGADEKAVNEKIKRAVETGAVVDLSPGEIGTQAFQRALANPSIGPKLVSKISPSTLANLRKDLDVPGVDDSEGGAERAFREAGIRSVREQIRIVSAVLKFLESLGMKASKVHKGKLKIDPQQVAKNAVWTTASTAIPGLRIAKSLAERVIRRLAEGLRLKYNGKCGGKAGEAIEDFAEVGDPDRHGGACQAATGEPDWINRGWRPYIWRGGLGATKWNYTRVGALFQSKNAKALTSLEEDRKKRGDRAPKKWKGGGGNVLRPLPAAVPPWHDFSS